MPEADREKWDAKYADPETAPTEPSAVLIELDPFLPRSGRAIDIAGGGGRHGIWLAGRGLDVTVADVSPVGLALAQQRAESAGVKINTLVVDLEQNLFPPGPWDLIVSVCYLWRPLFSIYPEALAPGGILAIVQPTMKNVLRHSRPTTKYLLEDGELPRLVAGLSILHHREGWLTDGRHDACLVARK